MNASFSTDDLLNLIHKIATFTVPSVNAGQTRLAYSREDEAAHQHIMHIMRQYPLIIRQDAAGNVFARLPGYAPNLPAVATGSHLDSVPQGGKFDGIVGVVSGLYALLQFKPQQLKRSLELIIFRCEESSRFAISCLGSKILTAEIDHNKWQTCVDNENKNIFQALDEAGYQSQNINQCALPDDYLSAFVEVHIEQGKCLESANKHIGIVNGIAAPTRFCIEVFGQADHSGATPMTQRQDALVTAANVIISVNQLANSEAYLGTVGTVGKLDVTPNAINVIPGYVRFYVDIRGIDSESIARVATGLKQTIMRLISHNNIHIDIQQLAQETPVKLDEDTCNKIKQLCIEEQLTYQEMLSGAGHDAMYMAKKFPTAMIFIPSVNGISHHPDEYSQTEDIILGAQLLTKTLAKLADI